ncbi:MAG TPA: nucleotidyltransferase family protein [Vicinamibacterales bacterium]|nr:nucleotidyltransferase family protein [Vicinamibacterales bacterium]
MTSRAIVLARGLGRRMQQRDAAATMTEDQLRAADAGLKAVMPVGGRPFLDFILGSLADAGVSDVALVVAPEHEAVRRYYADHPAKRSRLAFVVQQEAIGTANAVLAAERWTAGVPFLVMNADNLYPTDALQRLAALNEPGLPVFARDDLVGTSNIPDDRVLSFALLDVDSNGYLMDIIEKPSPQQLAAAGPSAPVSMNCWRFDAGIFRFCREIPRSTRNEFELPEAVGLAVRHGLRFKTVAARGPVLDLSRRSDTAEVERRLSGVVPRP